MQSNKAVSILYISFVLAISSAAQLNLRLPNGVRPAVEKVLSAYNANFQTIQGDTLSVTSNSIVFNSTVKPEGASECTLTRFATSSVPDYSWQAIMFESEDFSAASKKYATCYQQLRNIVLHTGNGNYKLEGEYETPNETKNFYSSIFSPKTADSTINRLRLEILLESDMTSWKLSILIYDMVHNDKEGNMAAGK